MTSDLRDVYFLDMHTCLAMVVSESSFGVYVCLRRPAGLHRNQRSCHCALVEEETRLPYCYYYLRVLYFANFCDLEKIAKLSTRKNFYQHIRHPGVYTITNCVMIFHFGSCMIFLFCSFLPFLFFLPVPSRSRKSNV